MNKREVIIQVYVDALTEALTAHAHNDFVQPLKPYLRQDPEMDTSQIELLQCQVISVVNTQFQVLGSKHDNPSKRNMERASGVIILNDPETNYPAHAHNDFVQPLKPYLRQDPEMDTSQIELLQCQVISVVNTQFQVLSG